MPTYDYHCLACGHAFELVHSIHESPRKKCPECGKNQLERKIGSGAGIVFKGSGFYQTDYRSKSYQEAAKADAPPKPDAAPKPEAPSKGADAAKKADAPANESSAKAEPGAGAAPAKAPAEKPAQPKKRKS